MASFAGRVSERESEEWLSVINGNEVSSKGRADADGRRAGSGRGEDGPVTHFSGGDDDDDDDEDVWSRCGGRTDTPGPQPTTPTRFEWRVMESLLSGEAVEVRIKSTAYDFQVPTHHLNLT